MSLTHGRGFEVKLLNNLYLLLYSRMIQNLILEDSQLVHYLS